MIKIGCSLVRMAQMTAIEEFNSFLKPNARVDLKLNALQHMLGFTQKDINLLISNPSLLVSTVVLLDDACSDISIKAACCLVNVSANIRGAEALVNLPINDDHPPLQRPQENIARTAVKFLIDPNSKIADQCCMLLANLSRHEHLVGKILENITKPMFNKMVDILCDLRYNKHQCKLHYVGPLLSNLSQVLQVREWLLDPEDQTISKLLPFLGYQDSLVRKGGVIATVRNLCLDAGCHDWLLSDEVDILPRLLLPLAGNEELDDEDNDKLPLELQYLPEDKKREDDPDLRCMLLEALTQLCAKRKNRQLIRDKNTYVILRELHKWEKDKNALTACENLVNILIRTEDEIGHDNLKELEVPEHIQSEN